MSTTCDPNSLINAARCFTCLPQSLVEEIKTYLLCQFAADWTVYGEIGSAGGTIAPPPAGTKNILIPNVVDVAPGAAYPQGLLKVGNSGTVLKLWIPNLVSARFLEITTLTKLTDLRLPNLTSLSPDDAWAHANLQITSCGKLTSINLPNLKVAASISLSLNTLLSTISLPALETCSILTVLNISLVQDLNCPNWSGPCGALNFPAGLHNVSLPKWYPGQLVGLVPSYIFGDALSAASVNHILARCASVPGIAGAELHLNLGTNAAPTGQGLTDKATLIAGGWTVQTN